MMTEGQIVNDHDKMTKIIMMMILIPKYWKQNKIREISVIETVFMILMDTYFFH